MPTAVEFASQLRKLAGAIQKEGPAVVETMAITGFSLVKLRIQSEGIAGVEYSEKPIPAWFLKGKAINKAGRDYLEEYTNDDEVTWGNFRKAQGLQNDFVDLTYTGRMLGGVVIQHIGKEGSKFVARLGGTDKEIDQKLDWNSKRYGDFLAPNAEEQAEINQVVNEAFTRLINQFLR